MRFRPVSSVASVLILIANWRAAPESHSGSRRLRRCRTAIGCVVTATLLLCCPAAARAAEESAPPTQLRSPHSQRVLAYLEHLVAACDELPPGEERCLGVLCEAFALAQTRSEGGSLAVQENRAALAAVGILLGEERLRHLAGFDPQQAIPGFPRRYAAGAALQGRNDLCRHFVVSAALTALAGPWLGAVAGLAKEQRDAEGGSGFSFADLAADRAGVQFARRATGSAEGARALQQRLTVALKTADLMPEIDGLREGLSTEEFQAEYGGPGDPRYRAVVDEIDRRLAECRLLKAAAGPEANQTPRGE